MNEKMQNNLPEAYIANQFAINGKTDFRTALDWVIFLVGVSEIDPFGVGDIGKIFIPVAHIKNAMGNKSKDFYKQLRKAIIRTAKGQCVFETDTYMDGVRMPRSFSIFSELGVEKINNVLCIGLDFNSKIVPLVRNLSENFLSIKPPVGIPSAHAINMLIYFKALRDRNRKRDGKFNPTEAKFTIEKLKARLNIKQESYRRIKDFKKYVITPIQEGVNKSGVINITKIEYEKTGRRITGVIFYIEDVERNLLTSTEKTGRENYVPTEEDVLKLTRSELLGYKYLMSKKVIAGIAYKQIVKKMPLEDCEGYEDLYIKSAWSVVERKTRIKNKTPENLARVFVTWWKNGSFRSGYKTGDTGKNYSELLEKLLELKKSLPKEETDRREEAKGVTNAEFITQKKEQDKQGNVPNGEVILTTKIEKTVEKKEETGFGGTAGLFDKYKKIKPNFDVKFYHEWREQPENEEVYRKIVEEKNSAFDTLMGGLQLSQKEKKKTLDNSIYQACRDHYKKS